MVNTEELKSLPPGTLWERLWRSILWAGSPWPYLRARSLMSPYERTQEDLKREALCDIPPLSHELMRRLDQHWDNETFAPDNPKFQASALAFSTMGLPDGY